MRKINRAAGFAMAAFLGFAIPSALELTNSSPAIAQLSPHGAIGAFRDDEWVVELMYVTQRSTRSYNYVGTSLVDDSSLPLTGGVATRHWTRERNEHVWYNDDYQYIIAWRPDDPEFIRLRVVDPYGTEILNRLLERDYLFY